MDKLNTIKIFLYENKNKLIVITSLIVVMITMTIIFLNKNSYKTESIVYENLLQEKEEEKEELPEVEHYFVDVKGAVLFPGVYSLEKGKRVVDAINEAGGLKENGDTSLLNLSMEVTDGMVIIVYSTDEVKNFDNTIKEETKKGEICNGQIINDACIIKNNQTTSSKETNSNTNTSSQSKEATSKININKADLKELITLPKIGEAKAKAIIEYRTKNGNFKTIEEIKNVSGIGNATFETLKNDITV